MANLLTNLQLSRFSSVLKHLEFARHWLDKAEAEYRRDETNRGELTLSLAEAEMREAWEESRRARDSHVDFLGRTEPERFRRPAAIPLAWKWVGAVTVVVALGAGWVTFRFAQAAPTPAPIPASTPAPVSAIAAVAGRSAYNPSTANPPTAGTNRAVVTRPAALADESRRAAAPESRTYEQSPELLLSQERSEPTRQSRVAEPASREAGREAGTDTNADGGHPVTAREVVATRPAAAGTPVTARVDTARAQVAAPAAAAVVLPPSSFSVEEAAAVENRVKPPAQPPAQTQTITALTSNQSPRLDPGERVPERVAERPANAETAAVTPKAATKSVQRETQQAQATSETSAQTEPIDLLDLVQVAQKSLYAK